MAITTVGTAGTAGGNAVTINPTWPSGVQANDVAVLVWTSLSTTTETVPTGFTLRSQDTAAGPSLRSSVYTKVCTGSESGTLAVTNSVTNRQSAVLSVYRGVATAAPIEAIADRIESTSGTTHASPTVTTVAANAVVLTAYSERSTTGTNNATPPSGYSEVGDTLALATGSGGSITAVALETSPPARAGGTAVTPGTWAAANSFATANVITWSMSLAPDAITVSAGLSGSGALSAAPTPAVTLPAALSGGGTLSATQTVAVARAAALSGSGTLSAGSAPAVARAAALSGGGTLTASQVPAVALAAALSGGGTLTALTTTVIASLSGTGTLTAGQLLAVTRAAALTGTGTLSAGQVVAVVRAAALSGSGALSAAQLLGVVRAAALSGSGTLTARVIYRLAWWTGAVWARLDAVVWNGGSWQVVPVTVTDE